MAKTNWYGRELVLKELPDLKVDRAGLLLDVDPLLEFNVGNAEKLWKEIEPVIQAAGYELFDLDLPPARGGAMKVFITCGTSSEKDGVNVDDCATVSRRLSSIDLVDQMLGEKSLLEVSSPGINRRLRREEHFVGAVGERVKVKVRQHVSIAGNTVTGTLKGFDGTNLVIKDEGSGEELSIPYADVTGAHVDYLFSGV